MLVNRATDERKISVAELSSVGDLKAGKNDGITNGQNVESIEKRVGQRIRQARREAGLTLAQLGAIIDNTRSMTISRYETGQRQVSITTLQKIAEATGKELVWFVTNDDLPPEARDGLIRLRNIYQNLPHFLQQDINDFAGFLYSENYDSEATLQDDVRSEYEQELEQTNILPPSSPIITEI